MPNFANTTIIGHLGKDPELRYTPKEVAVCNFSIAVTTGYGDRECTTWWRVTLFGKQAESAAKHLHKGAAVVVNGEPQNRPYEKDGQQRFSLEINANNWSFAGSKPEAGVSKPASTDGFEDQDIPF